MWAAVVGLPGTSNPFSHAHSCSHNFIMRKELYAHLLHIKAFVRSKGSSYCPRYEHLLVCYIPSDASQVIVDVLAKLY